MRATLATLAIATAALGLAASPALAGFQSSIRPLTAAERKAMTPSVWRRGCPVGLGDLLMVRTTFRDFSGRERRGRIVVHEDVAPEVNRIFRSLYRAKVPIRRMEPIERFRAGRPRAAAGGAITPTAGRSTSTRSRSPGWSRAGWCTTGRAAPT